MIANVLGLMIFAVRISSANGAYVGDIIYSGGADLIATSFKLYDQKGDMLYHIINPEAITFFISNSGEVFATNEQILFLYNLSGKITFIKRLNYPNGFGFSPDNTLFFASDQDGIYAYSMSGGLVFQFNAGRLFVSTNQARKFAVVSNDTLSYYEEGRLKFQTLLSTPFVRKIYFSENEKTIHVALPDTTETITIPEHTMERP